MPPRRRPGALLELSPWKIAKQIAALQAIYYVTAVILIFFTCVVMGTQFSLDLVLGWDALRGDTTTGWMLGFVWCGDAFVEYVFSFLDLYPPFFLLRNSGCDGAVGREIANTCRIIAILLVIRRSKLVLDFSLTVHGIHLVVVTMYSKAIPSNTLWWSLQFVSAASMTMGGIYACRWRELKPIMFGGAAAADAPGRGDGAGGSESAVAGGEEARKEAGFVMGSSTRGRGGDEGGSYEMVEMKDTEPAEKAQKTEETVY